jgi:hypothetical protein
VKVDYALRKTHVPVGILALGQPFAECVLP